MPDLYFPEATGFEALEELDAVAWDRLAHAYGVGVTGDALHDDVAASLTLLEDDPDGAIHDALYANICHQGTVYEATAYAVPFLVAVAAGKDTDLDTTFELLQLLALIAQSSAFATEDGSCAGALGEGVAERIREAFQRSAERLSAATAHSEALEEVAAAILAITSSPDEQSYERLGAALEAAAQDAVELAEPSEERLRAIRARKEQKRETVQYLKAGLIVTGRVMSITEYGAFIDIGGFDGLLHLLDMAHEPPEHPSDLLQVGDDVRVIVLQFDATKESLRVGLKQLAGE